MKEPQNATTYKPGREQIFALGSGGCGKTTGFASLPGKKFLYAFDPHALNSLRGQDIDYEEFVAEHMDLDAVTLKKDTRDRFSKAPEPKTYVAFEEHIEEAIKEGFFDQYDAVGFDSLSSLQDIVMDRIMHLNGRFGKWPEQADYTATINTVVKIVRTLVAQKKLVYITGHIEYKQEEASGKMMNTLALIGRLRNRLPLMFSEIWHFYADSDKDGKPHFYIRTTPDRYSPWVRTSIRGLKPIEDVTLTNWRNPTGEGVGRILKQARLAEEHEGKVVAMRKPKESKDDK